MNDKKAIKREKRKTAYAWAQVFKGAELFHSVCVSYAESIRKIKENTDKFSNTLPSNVINEIQDLHDKLKKAINCPICLNEIKKGDLKITMCGHKYCKNCFNKVLQDFGECSICKKKLKF